MPKQDQSRTDPKAIPPLSRISKEWDDYLLARSEAFRRYTQRKGMPMTYGAIKKER